MNTEGTGPGEWVPTRAVWVDPEILPRTVPDPETVERYRESFPLLPPITVQRDTFRMIGGLHRMHAAQGRSDYIRIIELDVPEERLFEAAVEDNERHGLPLNRDERMAVARKLYTRHRPDTGGETGEAWTVGRIAARAGVGERTVEAWLAKDRNQRAESDLLKVIPQNAELDPTPAVTRRLDNRDRWQPVDTKRSTAKPPPAPAKYQYQNAAALNQQTNGTVRDGESVDLEMVRAAALERSTAALERLAAAVSEADEHVVSVLDGLDQEHADEVYHLANRMIAVWGKVSDRALALIQATARQESA